MATTLSFDLGGRRFLLAELLDELEARGRGDVSRWAERRFSTPEFAARLVADADEELSYRLLSKEQALLEALVGLHQEEGQRAPQAEAEETRVEPGALLRPSALAEGA